MVSVIAKIKKNFNLSRKKGGKIKGGTCCKNQIKTSESNKGQPSKNQPTKNGQNKAEPNSQSNQVIYERDTQSYHANTRLGQSNNLFIKNSSNKSGMKVRIHPLFLICGLFYTLTGKLPLFIIYSATALLHELGHSFIASSRGYALNKITLMPFGAVVSGELDGLAPADEIKIALAGPILNLLVGTLFVATWWIYPECYAYTDVAVEANFSMALVNFIPAYPLDGGRVLSAVIAVSTGRKKAVNICKKVGSVMGVVLIGLFIFSLFNTPNPSLILFALFVVFGNNVKNSDYVRALSVPSMARLRHGMPFKKQGIDKKTSIRRLLSILDPDCINEIVVFDGTKPIITLSQEKISQIAITAEYSAPIERYLIKN